MRIAVIGAGYVGLTTGACLAEIGHQVALIEIDAAKVLALRKGKLLSYEPQLQPLLTRNLRNRRLQVHHDLKAGLKNVVAIFLALPTPPQEDGASNLQYVLQAAEDIAPHLKSYTLIITKSTVPVGTASKIRARLKPHTKIPFDVVSNPEFLREGKAVQDFLKPQRIVIGSSSAKAKSLMQSMYASFSAVGCPLLFMDEASAEMSKYAANAFLATKISFINEIANLCSQTGADVRKIQQALALDTRIGKHYLQAGLGYGGSCLPKDLAALRNTAQKAGLEAPLLQAVHQINQQQCLALWKKAQAHFKAQLKGRIFAIWGLAFKPDTDDIRAAPALANIAEMQAAGLQLRVYDPAAMENVRAQLSPGLYFAKDPYDALKGAQALFIMTEWPLFSAIDLSRMKEHMQRPVIFDGRGIYDPKTVREAGFQYYAIGEP